MGKYLSLYCKARKILFCTSCNGFNLAFETLPTEVPTAGHNVQHWRNIYFRHCNVLMWMHETQWINIRCLYIIILCMILSVLWWHGEVSYNRWSSYGCVWWRVCRMPDGGGWILILVIKLYWDMRSLYHETNLKDLYLRDNTKHIVNTKMKIVCQCN